MCSNMRQVYAGCAVYAGDFNDWYPVWIATSGHPLNEIHGEDYTTFVVGPNNRHPMSQSRSRWAHQDFS